MRKQESYAAMRVIALRTGLGFGIMGLAAALITGCKFFDISNPLLPASRLYAVPVPSLMEVTTTYQTEQRLFLVEVRDVDIQISSFPNDGTPGCYINNYLAEYYDNSGNPIDSLDISKSNLAVGVYIPPASNGQVSTVTVRLPIDHQEVRRYGRNQNFAFAPSPRLREELVHSISCRVLLSGQDDNYNQIEIPVSIPIRFIGNVTQ